MNNEKNTRICPVERAGGLDNSFRRLLQNPRTILKIYISRGMTVLDLGCGPGFFSIEIAKLLNDSGKVIAADLQEGMLEKVIKKILKSSPIANEKLKIGTVSSVWNITRTTFGHSIGRPVNGNRAK